jgi:hypothetical protein
MSLIYRTTDVFQFEQVKLLLDAEEITFQTKNTVASMYNNFGSYEIYVSSQDEQFAKEIIKNAFK